MVLKIALIGAGRIGHVHASTIAAHPDAKLACVIDPIASAAHTLAASHGAAVASLEEALASDVAAVLIASATNTHGDLIKRAADAGKAVFCEKPLDLDAGRARACAAHAKAAGVILFVGFQRRFDPHFAELKNQIDCGAIGTLEMLHIISRDPGPPLLNYLETSGGLFKDMTIHDFDMARWLLGEEPVSISVHASAQFDDNIKALGDFDSALVSMQTSSGKLCVISNSRRATYGYDQRIEAHGSAGMTVANNEVENLVIKSDAQGVHGAKPKKFFLERYMNAYRRELDHFIDIVKDGAEPIITAHDGVQALVIAEAAAESQRDRKIVAISVNK